MCEFVTAVVRVGEGYMQFVCLAGPCAPQVGVREVGRAARERVPRADWTHTSTTHSPGPLQHGAPNRPPGSVPLLQCALPAALLPRSRPGPAWVQPVAVSPSNTLDQPGLVPGCMHWRRKWQPTPVFLPGESQGRRSLGGLPSMGSHRVRHD